MRIGILEILALPSRRPSAALYRLLLTKQYASITPQAVSVWCRQLGHETFYATYYGLGDPRRLLPSDLDVVFISCYTQASPIAYALGLLYRRAGTRTVLGGPHAKAFPTDCLRFFDLVVKECDRGLVADVLAGHFDPGSLISSDRPFDDVPTVEERMPELRTSAFFWGRPRLSAPVIPLLASVGCPYQCDFCIDWNNPYRTLPLDRLAVDLRYLSEKLPRAMMAFHDPNFAVKFDQVFEVLEAVPPARRMPYIIESSLTVLRGDRVRRLKETGCFFVAPGVESWMDYSNKAGLGRRVGAEKVERVAEHFGLLHAHVPYLQANFMFGLDTDMGDDPVALTKLFMDRTPFVWHALNIPVPFGNTPLYESLMAAGRILKSMPFAFYYAPYLVMEFKHYDPIDYYEKFIDLSTYLSSPSMLRRRLRSTPLWRIKAAHQARTSNTRTLIQSYRRILDRLRTDPSFLAFHEGRSEVLPEFYHQAYERMLKPYAELIGRSDRIPTLEGGPAPGDTARKTAVIPQAVPSVP